MSHSCVGCGAPPERNGCSYCGRDVIVEPLARPTTTKGFSREYSAVYSRALSRFSGVSTVRPEHAVRVANDWNWT